MRAYVDSDILIWHLRGERRAANLFRRLAQERGTELWTGALQRAEVVIFMRPGEVAAAIAATGGKLYTLNVTHYPITDIAVAKGW